MDLQNAGMDMKTLIHVGIELVVMAGMAFWMNKKIGAVEAGQVALVAQMKKYEEIIAQQNSVISRHDAMLRQIFTGGPPPVQDPRSVMQMPLSTGGDSRSVPDQKAVPLQQNNSPVPVSVSGNSQKKGVKEVTADDLDKILQEELRKERLKTKEKKEEIEVDTKVHRKRLKGKKKE